MEKGKDMERSEVISRYAKAVSTANNEAAKKELFINLLNDLFGDKDSFGIIPKFASGSEKSITNIDRVGKKSQSGRADTQYGTVIIEFENDLKKTGAHAKEQLADYLVGNWNSGIKSRFTLIATDCITWIVYAPDYKSLFGLGKLKADKIKLEKITEFKVRSGKSDEFYFFLDRYLFGTEPIPATLNEIRERFGHGSDIFQSVIYHMNKAYEALKSTSEMKVARTHWEKFLRIAYGKFDAADHIFLIHSYLSVLAKMIAYEVISGDEYIDDDEVQQILSGAVFRKKNVQNFTDNDFFRWVENKSPELKNAFRTIADGLSEMDFSNVSEDILKGVYQELVDDKTKHDLGECYTPDWLCARIVEEMKPRPGQKILDPSCGSGSFLKAAANHLISNKPDITASELNECLYGIDVHPLSVQITKATLLIAYGKKLAAEKEAIRLNVYLANSLLLTEEAGLLGKLCRVNVDNKKIDIPISVFSNYKALSKYVDTAERLAGSDYIAGKKRTEEQIKKIFAQRGFEGDSTLRGAAKLYEALLAAKINNRNGIWGYILANTYAPIALKEQFDLVLGNPPWLTYSDIKVKDYQEEIKGIAKETGTLPDSAKLLAHIELAAIFVGQCANYFLKPYGRLALVMTRSIFSADHLDCLRQGRITHFTIDQLWDLNDVSPLFKVPACVIFGAKTPYGKKMTEIKGLSFSGKLPTPNASKELAASRLVEEEATYYFSFLNNLTAWSRSPIQMQGDVPYKNRFSQGATLVPRRLCFVDIDQEIVGDLKDRIIRVKSSEAVHREAKGVWKNVKASGLIHTKYLFLTFLASNLVPFGLTGGFYVVLPLYKGKMINPEEMVEIGDLESHDWFRDVTKIYDANITENSKEKNLTFNRRLDFQRGITSQEDRRRYAVVYNRSGTNAASAVIDTDHSSWPYIYDHAVCYMKTNREDEAWYVCAFLNARITNDLIKPFQSGGLQGERNIHKKILDIPFPEFDPQNDAHMEVVDIAKRSAKRSSDFIKEHNFDEQGNNLTAAEIGNLRSQVRGILKDDLDRLDPLIRMIIGSNLKSAKVGNKKQASSSDEDE